MNWVYIWATALGLAGCVAAPQGPVSGGADQASCGAARLGGYVGQPRLALDEQYLPQTVRFIRPGDAVTEDFSPSRLNVTLDRADQITGFWCG
ncbi:I78 family peptidase inhibitor [Gemmobacter fulvus]|uniref:I78 family peptidase inhibitor n=1 Tax=Gemmobacter fulvus TaxID=2840474 RepID=UPI0027967D70|nr:I78 family peptidase inhibitor [Gemmobacter fulvus]MDQ1848689.1 I78 family peptidase inhibitor [Gemmobacter fulvus]